MHFFSFSFCILLFLTKKGWNVIATGLLFIFKETRDEALVSTLLNSRGMNWPHFAHLCALGLCALHRSNFMLNLSVSMNLTLINPRREYLRFTFLLRFLFSIINKWLERWLLSFDRWSFGFVLVFGLLAKFDRCFFFYRSNSTLIFNDQIRHQYRLTAVSNKTYFLIEISLFSDCKVSVLYMATLSQ